MHYNINRPGDICLMVEPLHVFYIRSPFVQSNRHIFRCMMDKRLSHGVTNHRPLHEYLILGRDSSKRMNNLRPGRNVKERKKRNESFEWTYNSKTKMFDNQWKNSVTI